MVSIIPGIESRAPERTDTRSGLLRPPKLLPELTFDLFDCLQDGFRERRRVGSAVIVIVAAHFGAYGKSRRDGQTYGRHLREVCALTAEQVAHGRVAVSFLAKGINVVSSDAFS